MDTEREKSFTRVRGQDSETPGSRLVARKIPSQNVVSRLVCRELFGTTYRLDLAEKFINTFHIFPFQTEQSEHSARVPSEHSSQLHPRQRGEAALFPTEVQS